MKRLTQEEISDIEKALPSGQRVIPLTRRMYSIVDSVNYEHLNRFKWYADKAGNYFYATRNCYKNKDKVQKIKLHRVVSGVDDPKAFVDHIDHNTLNNTLSNLRKCSQKENFRNMAPRKGRHCKYKGISFDKKKNLYRAVVTHNYKHYRLGRFKCEIEAAKAYDKKAKELFGEFANPNFK